MKTIQSALTNGVKKIERMSPTALLDCQLFIEAVLNRDRLYLIMNKDQILTDEELLKYDEMIEKRLKNIPVQYIINFQEFMGLGFYVDERVLVPRPDTEILVEAVLEYVKENEIKEPKILELGTGSGAIPISLAHFIKDAFVTTVDLSEGALEVAKINAKNNNLNKRVEFVHGDMIKYIDGCEDVFDIIVSNPPYIPSEDMLGLQKEVILYEPKMALDGGADGLYFYKNIVEKGTRLIQNGGILAFEVGHDQAEAVRDFMIKTKEYKKVVFRKDLQSINRVVVGFK
jgi:release factor glutamine methyltransferase